MLYSTWHSKDKQKALFLTSIGQKMYAKLKTWINPTPFSELLTEIIEKIKARTREETERYRFFKRQQQSGIDYMSELRRLAKTCNFADYLNTALRDQFVCGLRDSQIQRELLSMKNLTVANALEKSQAMEVASRETRNFNNQKRACPPRERNRNTEAAHMQCHGCHYHRLIIAIDVEIPSI